MTGSGPGSRVLGVPARLRGRSAAEGGDAERPASRRRWPRIAAVGFLGVAALLAASWVVLQSSLLAVDRVVVTGASRVPVADVLAAAAVEPGRPLARVDAGGVRDRVAALPAVRGVEVGRAWPDTLRVEVTERQPLAAVAGGGGVRLLDRDGVAFAEQARLPAGTPRLQVDDPGPGDPATRSALRVLQALPAELRGRVATVRAPGPDDVTLVLADGRRVLWGAPERGEDKVAAAQALLRLPGTVYDVSSPDVVTRR